MSSLLDAGVLGVDGLAPGGGIFFVDELRDWNLGEIGIAHEVGAVKKGAAKGFGGEVDGLGRAVAEFREIEALENIEDFDEAAPPEEGGGALMMS